MKKILSMLLCLVMLLGLAACGGAPAETKTEGTKPFDFDSLSAEELEAYAASLRTKLSSYQFESVCKIEAPSGSVGETLVRETFVRSGYNAYSRSVAVPSTLFALSFEDGAAVYNDWTGGRFCAENLSADDFDAAIALLSPHAAFQDWRDLPGLKKEGRTVSFEGDGDFASLLGDYPVLTVKTATGTRTFDDEGFFAEETLVFTGDHGEWKDVTVTYTSRVTSLRDAALKVEPANAENAVAVSDLRAPRLYADAVDRLLDGHEELALTLSEGTVNGAEETHTDSALSLKNGDFFLEERQAVKKDGEWSYATHFIECRGEVRREATYEQVFTPDPDAEEPPKKTDPEKEEDPIVEATVTAEEKSAAFRSMISERIPPVSAFASLSLSDEPGQTDLSFELQDSRWSIAVAPQGATLKKGEGVAQIADGELKFVRYTVEWSDGTSFSFSLSLNATENVTLGTIEAPEPVDPNTAYGDHHDD